MSLVPLPYGTYFTVLCYMRGARELIYMNRDDKILHHISKDGYGIEIGPSHSPVTPKKDGYNVHIIDHMNREQLLNKYNGHDVILENIEEVDFVWQGETYTELTGKRKHYDWIIASHMIEHSPDLIGFLNECDAILKDDGVISLVVPDKRYCFDQYRPISGISKVIDNHFQKSKMHTPGTVAEYYLNVVSREGNITWNKYAPGKNECIHSVENAFQKMKSAQLKNEYLDVHAWCFVPHSFRLIIHDLYCLGLIPFQEVEFFTSKGGEFFMTLSRKGKGVSRSRLEILRIIESEVKDKASVFEALFVISKGIIKYLLRIKPAQVRR
jgi:2-polyprenyl-3-methyl-5-hydroxy-6-metoxy-1,4-benzoquinol methylase